MIQLKGINTVYIASDHAGYALKETIVEDYLTKKNIKFIDLGTNSEESVDYPKFAKKLCKKINSSSIGVLICGSGIGVSISANRHKHIRASLCHDVKTAIITRKHNDSNVICLKGRPGKTELLNFFPRSISLDKIIPPLGPLIVL